MKTNTRTLSLLTTAIVGIVAMHGLQRRLSLRRRTLINSRNVP
jgi:hypothetical protein